MSPDVPHQHLDGAPGPQVGPEHLRDPLGRRDVDGERLRGPGHLGLGVQEGDGGHLVGRCVQQVSEDQLREQVCLEGRAGRFFFRPFFIWETKHAA